MAGALHITGFRESLALPVPCPLPSRAVGAVSASARHVTRPTYHKAQRAPSTWSHPIEMSLGQTFVVAFGGDMR
jgi:hypothetical protein